MFCLIGFPGFKSMLLPGLFFTVLGLVISAFIKPSMTSSEQAKKQIAQHFLRPKLRLLIIGFIAVILYLTPMDFLIKVGISSPVKQQKIEVQSKDQ